MLRVHDDLNPGVGCYGELLRMADDTEWKHHVICTACGTEMYYLPDCEWVTFILPGAQNGALT